MSNTDIGVKVCSKEVKAKHMAKHMVKHMNKPLVKHAVITNQLNQPIFGGNTNGQFRDTRQYIIL